MKSISLILKGVFMGIADLVPGVSGGTIALVFGIYDEFIFSLSKISISSLFILKNNGIKAFWKEINGIFLLKLFSGIITGVSLFTFLIDWLIKNHSIPLWAFFSGIILSSVIFIYKNVKKPKVNLLLYFVLGLLFSFIINQLSPSLKSDSLNGLYLFFSCLIAISAMILPGISGAYMLILFGTYSEVISTIKSLLNIFIKQDFTNINLILYKTTIIGCGIISGLLIFSKLFKWLLVKHYDVTLVFMIGLMLGSIHKIWPWKEGGENILPQNYPDENHLILSIFSFIFGILFINTIQFFEKKNINDKQKN
tara:strand:+ start:1475 stop:2401 length:927 start_codon:yes stop_codon:yes gene_type:complete